MRNNIVSFILLVSIMLLSLSSAKSEASYCVTANVTDISPSSVEINSEFTVGIVVENCGTIAPESVAFEFKDVSPYIEIKEPLRIEIGKLVYSNSKRFLLYHMKALDNAVPGDYLMKYTLYYNVGGTSVEDNGNFSVTVTGEKAELNIASLKTKPVLPKEGETVELSLRIENFGDGTANSVKVHAEHNFQGTKESFIGTLDAGEDGPATFTFIAPVPGEYSFPVKVLYKDDFGEHEIQTEVKLIILEKESNLTQILILAAVIILFAIVIFFLIRKNVKKDKFIKQVLENNHKNK